MMLQTRELNLMSETSPLARHAAHGLLVAVLAALALPLRVAAAQTQSGWLQVGTTYQTPLATPTMGSTTLLGAGFGHAIGGSTALAMQFGLGTQLMQPEQRQNPTTGDAWIPPRQRLTLLDLTGELRARVTGGRDLDNSEVYLLGGGGILNAHVEADAARVQPQLHAGLGMTFPFAESFGLAFRAAYYTAKMREMDLGLAPTGAATSADASRWVGSVRFGASFYLRPVSRPRRIPPQYVPDATGNRSTTSFQGALLAQDGLPVNLPDASDDRSGFGVRQTGTMMQQGIPSGDPDGSSGAILRGPYVSRTTALRDSATALRSRAAYRRAERDTFFVLADPNGAPLPDATAPVDTPPRPVTPAARSVSPAKPPKPASKPSKSPVRPATPARSTVPPVDDGADSAAMVAAVRAVVRDAVAEGVKQGMAQAQRAGYASGEGVRPEPEDAVTTELDAQGEYLVVRPALDQGRIRQQSIDRLMALAAKNVKSGRPMSYVLVVDSPIGNPGSTDALIDDAYYLRSMLLTTGVLSGRVRVREVETSTTIPSLRIIVRASHVDAATR